MEEERSNGSLRRYEKDTGGLIMEGHMELKIYSQEDRLNVAQILIKNGYTVSQFKRNRSPTGKSVDYFLKVTADEENAETSK